MIFDDWLLKNLESIAPGFVFGEFDQICMGCLMTYVVQVNDSMINQISICPYCNTQNES